MKLFTTTLVILSQILFVTAAQADPAAVTAPPGDITAFSGGPGPALPVSPAIPSSGMMAEGYTGPNGDVIINLPVGYLDAPRVPNAPVIYTTPTQATVPAQPQSIGSNPDCISGSGIDCFSKQ